MDINDIINSIYKLPQPSLDTLIASISEVEYPKNFICIGKIKRRQSLIS